MKTECQVGEPCINLVKAEPGMTPAYLCRQTGKNPEFAWATGKDIDWCPLAKGAVDSKCNVLRPELLYVSKPGARLSYPACYRGVMLG